MKMKTGITIIFLLIFSGISRGDEQKVPVTDKKQKRLNIEAKVFTKSPVKVGTKSGEPKINPKPVVRDTFIDNNKDGINDLLNKKTGDNSLMKFLNEKGSSYFAKEKPIVGREKPQPKIEEELKILTPSAIPISESKVKTRDDISKSKPSNKIAEKVKTPKEPTRVKTKPTKR